MRLLYKSAFTIALGLVSAISAAAWLSRYFIEQARFEEAFARQQSAVQKSAARFLRPEEFRAPQTPAAQRQWRSFTQDLDTPEIGRIVVWNRDQRIIFSDLPTVVGKRLAERKDLTQALKEGRPFYQRRKQDSQLPGLAASQDFLDLYIPLRLGTASPSLGAVEIHLDSQAVLIPVRQQIQWTTWALALSAVLGLGLIFLLRNSLRRALQERRQREQVEQMMGELMPELSRHDLATLSKKLQDKARQILEADIVEVELWNKQQLQALAGSDSAAANKGKSTVGQDSQWIFQQRQPLLWTNVAQKAGAAPVAIERRGIQGYVAVPILLSDDSIAGVLRLLSRSPRDFAAEVSLLQQIAGAVAMAVEHTRLQEQYREQTLKLEIAEQKLANKGTELSRADYEIEQLAHALARDLQEPLRVVTSSTHLLAKNYGAKLDATAQEYTHNALDGAKRMHTLIGDVVAYARVASAPAKAFGQFDCNAVLRKTLEQLRDPIREKGAVVTHDKLPAIEADETQFAQLMQHLVGNALKYCHNSVPRVHVSCGKDYGFWSFKVKDNGIGIEPEFTEKIFAIFERLHTGKEYPGTGMGLAVCKRVVEHHGGKIWVESQPGVGSTFCFTLPFKPVAKPRPASVKPGGDDIRAER